MPVKKFIITYLNYIAGKKLRMGNVIERCIFFGIFNSILYHFHPYNLFSQLAYKNADTASAAIQVVDGFVSCKAGKIPGNGI